MEQEAYANAVLGKFGMAYARPATPLSDARPVFILEDEMWLAEDTTYFRSATGSLGYLRRCTKPDITHSMMVHTRSITKPGPRTMQKLKVVLRYLKGTRSIGIRYSEDAEGGNFLMTVVATSSREAEFVTLSKGCNIIAYFRYLLDTIHQTQEEASVALEDNSGGLKLTCRFGITPKTKAHTTI